VLLINNTWSAQRLLSTCSEGVWQSDRLPAVREPISVVSRSIATRALHIIIKTMTRFIPKLFLALILVSSPTQATESGADLSLTFDENRYEHKWSSENLHEFTPHGQSVTGRWSNMLTFMMAFMTNKALRISPDRCSEIMKKLVAS